MQSCFPRSGPIRKSQNQRGGGIQPPRCGRMPQPPRYPYRTRILLAMHCVLYVVLVSGILIFGCGIGNRIDAAQRPPNIIYIMAFLRQAADRPFFFQAHYTIPHANNEGGRATGNGMEVPDLGSYADRDWPDPEKGFAAMIGRLDRDVGRILDLLRELKIEKNTLVLFTSDNGPHQEGGHQVDFFDSNGPLRGYKRDLYEGGIRVPMIAWWPGTVARGSQCTHPSAFWDFLPTACELAGIERPVDIDGISYAASLLGKHQPVHPYLYWQFRNQVAVREGTFKAVIPGSNKRLELYNLSLDIGEQEDLADQYPDRVAEFRRVIEEVGKSGTTKQE